MDSLANEIKSKSTELNNQNFDFLKPMLQNKRFIFLGESSHCVKQYSVTKVNLIKYLHEELGFNIIAFESEMGDCSTGDYRSPKIDAKRFMKGSVGRAWHNESNLELFRYIKSKEHSSSLHFTGVDVQQSKEKHFSAFLQNHLPSPLKERYVEWDEHVTEMLFKEGIIQRLRLRQEAKKLENMGRELIRQIKTQNFPNELLAKIIGQTLDNRLTYFKASMEKGFSKLFKLRDELMAKNLEFLAKEIYPNEKFIIWAHNMHIKKESSVSRFSPYRSFVENLPDSMKQDSFVIGLYAKEGKMKDYIGREYSIKKVNTKHLEWILSHSPHQNCFISCSLDWAQQKWKAYEGGGMPVSFIPSKQYDGILYFKHINPA
ncbi:erythromycin esterase family protein [Virgibacillus sp. FSP13]